MANQEHNFVYIFKDNEGNLITMYPRTVAQQVTLVDGTTALDHINSSVHLYSSEKEFIRRPNMPSGILVLDENGMIPLDKISDSLIAIKTEFADIPDMLANGATVKEGTLVMVLDASADPSVTSGWAIYRRKPNEPNYQTLDGWTKVGNAEALDLNLDWDSIPGKPNATPAEIDAMVEDAHSHSNLDTVNSLTESNGHLAYKGMELANDADVVQIFEGDHVYDKDMDGGDFWLKSSYAQSWWDSNTVPNAGVSCESKYEDQDTMTEAPRLRTKNTVTMEKMFKGCSDLVVTQQYQTDNVQNFDSMYSGCESITTVPCMSTRNAMTAEYMFYQCSSLKYSPEMSSLENVNSVRGMYSGCNNLEYVLPFGSTENVTNMIQWFNGCSSLKKIDGEIDFSSVTEDSKVVSMFNGCIDLEEVAFVPGTLTVSLSLANTNLTKECIIDILNGLPEIEGEPADRKTLVLTGIPEVLDVDDAIYNAACGNGWIIETDKGTYKPITAETPDPMEEEEGEL